MAMEQTTDGQTPKAKDETCDECGQNIIEGEHSDDCVYLADYEG